MNSRERMLAAINHQPVDRIPTDMWATPEVWQKLRAHFGPETDILKALNVDGFAGIGPAYIGPAQPQIPEGETVNMWGMRHKQISHGTGEYWEQSVYPLSEAQTIDDLEKYQWPQANWFDYSTLREQAEKVHAGRLIQSGYMAPFLYHNLLRGLELSLMDPLLDPDFTHYMVGKIADFFYDHHRRMFEAADGLIDVAQVTDDFGSQHGPLISLQTFREFYKPHMQRFCDLCREFNIKIFHHDDGAIRDFLPDLVELGIDVLNPVQWVCPGMELKGLKADFGKRICFHGGIENQDILPFGTPDDVRREVRHCIDDLASDGTGYILASSHNIQSNTPLENILAMYEEAHDYGKF